ncbi:hypothetical protein SLEP1_g50365 [Rubroshorea leprosula]|uniref:Reverse transcriptase domain-containing protein n=1 Tax=Rubroshorea leprosula TaxID=152421 RepID=A0AAV5M245_9ROSI|nr:hypothetical protein SLEP1_g50365 [Rubroshorea leprosula]
MVRTFIGSRPLRNEMDEQEDTQLSDLGLNDFRPMPRNLFVGGAEQDQLSGTDDDERTLSGYATQPEHFQIPTGTRQRHPRQGSLQHERPERSTVPARTTELEERTKVLEMAMGKILVRLILDDPLIPLLNRDPQPAAVVATRNSSALSNVVVPTRPRGSGRLNLEPSSSKHNEELIKKNTNPERQLKDVHKKEGESLRDYMQRFNKATLDIDNVPDTICLSALLHGLKSGRFLDNLLENPPKTWNEVNDRLASFILSEDFQSSKRRADNRQSKSHEQPLRREEKKKKKTQIQHWIKRPPPPLHDSLRVEKSKHCDYHRAYGYNTEDCQHLQDELEFLACNGKLEGYVQKPYAQQPTQTHFVQGGRQFNKRGQGQRTATQNQKDRKGVGYARIPSPSSTINMISGGIHSGGQSARGQPRFRMAFVSFLVVKMESTFNAILGRATLCELKAVISQPHLCMKFPTPQGVGMLKGNQKMTRACYQDTFKKVELAAAPRGSSEIHKPTQPGQQTMSISDIEHRPEGVEQKAEPIEPVEAVPLNPDVPKRTIKIDTKLTEEERAELLEFLNVNQDVFAWTTEEMPAIPMELTVHKLSTDPTKRPVVQKRHLFGPEKQAAIDEEIQKLLQAGFIRRVEYSELVSNPVLIKKPNGKWRMCIDFTNLNEVCPKDPHPLPNVEKLVERVAGHEWMSFLDASSGYHQKLVQVAFKLQIGRNIEVYVDDMIVTNKRAKDHIDDLNDTFQNLRRAQMKLNSLKCTFAVESGKFLGYVVSKKGIEVNPEKVQAVHQMEPPKTVKDVQRLTGRVAALHRFITRLAERCLSFFKALR